MSVISPAQFWHSQPGPAAPYSQEKRGAERKVTGDRGEENEHHIGYTQDTPHWKPNQRPRNA